MTTTDEALHQLNDRLHRLEKSIATTRVTNPYPHGHWGNDNDLGQANNETMTDERAHQLLSQGNYEQWPLRRAILKMLMNRARERVIV